jgi:uncharacterized protein (TIGR02266 family)
MTTKQPKNILLADDSVFFRTKIGTPLSEAGHIVTFAIDGREVIRKIEKNPKNIDLLILDLKMPNIDGFGVLKWIKDNGHSDRFPIVVITGVPVAGQVADQLISLGVTGFMGKSCPPEQVIHRINPILFPKKADTRNPPPRVPVSLQVDYTIGDVTHTGLLLNISASGLFLRTRTYILPGSEVGLKFSLPDSKKVFEISGTVKWSTPSTTSSRRFGGAGVYLVSISDEDREALRRFVDRENKKLLLEE